MTETIEATSSAATAEKPAKAAGKKSGGLSSMLLPELKQLARSLGIKGAGAMRKSALVDAISAKQGASRSQSDPAPVGGRTTKTPQTVTSSAQGAGELAAAADSGGRPNGAARSESGRDQSLSSRDPSQHGRQSRQSRELGQQSRQTRDSGQQDQQDPHSRDSGQQDQQDPQSRDSGQQNGQDRNRDQAKRDFGQGQQSRDSGQQGQQNRDFGQQGQQSRDSGQQGQQNRDSGQQGQQNRDSGQQSRDSGQQGQQNRDFGQQTRDSNKENLRDDDRGSSRNSRRRNRNRDRDRDRYRDRDVRRREGGGTDAEPQVSDDEVLIPVAGILDLLDNYAFVRTSGYLPGPNDVYVALSMVRKFGLRKGDAITGAVRQTDGGSSGGGDQRREKFNPIVRIDTVNGTEPEASQGRVEFSKLTPLYAADRLRLETEPNLLIGRLIDIVAPVGKGQRGLIVSPSKAGKTIVLQQIANAITTNNPECHLMVVLVDERPEEVTDMQRAVKGEVIASTFDRPAEDHTTVAELAIERAKRLVELGHDVVVLLDSITRLGRAYNLAAPASGRILSGGVDSSALYPPKRFFGAARNIEDGGSLTILATALIETGSKMDEVIFEEFKGTGNMELRLRREFADKRIFPAIDVDSSGTRREELLMTKDELAIVWKLRRVLSGLDGQQALELVINKLKSTKSNVEFLMQVNKTTATASGIRGQDDD